MHADYTVYAERTEKAGHAFKAKKAKQAKYALFAYEAGKIVGRRDLKLPQYEGKRKRFCNFLCSLF